MIAIIVLALVTLERFGELALAERNTRRLLAQGAYEVGKAHYPWITAILTAWLLGLWLLAWNRPVSLVWTGVFFAFMALKLWVIFTLGPRWTARIIITPNAPLVSSGAYRAIPHPNYAFLMGEIVTLPLAFGLWWFSAVAALAVAAILAVRIKSEDAALAGATS